MALYPVSLPEESIRSLQREKQNGKIVMSRGIRPLVEPRAPPLLGIILDNMRPDVICLIGARVASSKKPRMRHPEIRRSIPPRLAGSTVTVLRQARRLLRAALTEKL